jgi:hypothetical protein
VFPLRSASSHNLFVTAQRLIANTFRNNS